MLSLAIGKISLCVEKSGFVEASPDSHANLGVMVGQSVKKTLYYFEFGIALPNRFKGPGQS